MIQAIFNENVTVKRRIGIDVASRDSLNNPIYGVPTSGAGWSTVYTNMPCRLAFSSRALQFAMTAERVTPSGIMYYDVAYTLKHEDRILTSTGIEYIVTSIADGYIINTVLDHYEALLDLP